MYAVYSGRGEDSYLLVDYNSWVVNGHWYLEKKGDVFLYPLTKAPMNVRLVGYIDYDGDYNSTLERFKNGEGKHLDTVEVTNTITAVIEPVKEVVPEFCKKKYYGIKCSCSKCER